MAERPVWLDPNGKPLKFQDGDYVRIETKDPAALPFLSGYVRGYDLHGVGETYSAAYYLFKMGEPPLPGAVREGCLILAPDPHSQHVHRGRVCGICGAGDRPQGLSIFAGPVVKN